MTLPTDGDSKARLRFESTRSEFERDGSTVDSAAFEAIVRDYPNDPIAPHALLYGAMADVKTGADANALMKLDELAALAPTDAALLGRAALFRGFALSNLDRNREALPSLTAGKTSVNQTDSAEVSFWHASMAGASAANQNTMAAIIHYDAWWFGGNEAERSYVVDRITALSVGLSGTALEQSYSEVNKRAGPGKAILGARLAEELAGRGDAEGARRVLASIAQARQVIGAEASLGGTSGPGNPELLGALLPLSGRLNRIGELSLRGLVMASQSAPSAAAPHGEFSAFELITRDTSSVASNVSSGIRNMVASDVLAVIGPFDGSSVTSVSPLAASLGLPVISLAPRGSAGGAVFSIRHSAETRARSLARYAYGKGIRDFAILAPATAYGRVVGGAFEEQVKSLGGNVIVQITYASGTTSFTKDVARLKKPWSALFVPDQAKTLALIAPALASRNLNARPVGKRSKHGRSILLLSTAEGIGRGYLRAAGRYSFGAVVAPGFFPDRTDPTIADFVARYEDEFGTEPSAHEAYAYDAATVVRHAVDQGAASRQQLGQALHVQKVPGLTGDIEFGRDNRRSDPGLLFEVQQPIAGQFELRALR